jgi:capsule polysaccharide export protein KpsE/RkpR
LPGGKPQKKPKEKPMGKATGSAADCMNDRVSNSSAMTESSAVEIEIATRRLMAALDSLENAVERRRDADRDENELAARIARGLPTSSTARW